MSTRNHLRLLLGGLASRRGAPPAAASGMRDFLDRSRLVAALIFFVTVAAIVLVSSAGISTHNAPLMVDQIATSQISALLPFSYESSVKTQAARDQLLNQVPPVYRLDPDPLRRFETAARLLLSQLSAFENAHPSGPPPLLARRPELLRLSQAFNAHASTYQATADDLAAIIAGTDPKTRAELFDNGLATLRDLYAQGIADATLAHLASGAATLFQIARPSGDVAQRPVHSMADALTILRVSLSATDVPRPASQAAFRLFCFGLTPNVVFDRAATAASHAAAARAIKPVTVNVVRGQTIIEAGSRVTPEQHEMLLAHRDHLRRHADTDLREGLTLFGRVLLVLAMVVASLLYIRIEDPETLRSNVRCALLALVVIANLALVRANYSLGGADFFIRDGSWASTLPYVAPTALAPLIVAILIDAGSGIFMALFVSIFTGVIYGNRLDLLVLTFLASLVTIYFGRDARRRARLIHAAGAGGLTVAAFAALIGFANQTPYDTLVRQMAAGLATGLLTGIGAAGLLPLLESLFKRTTDITLLELTDYNHPLLRLMQFEAPGTYHHSLVVAQLSENAANAIGANPLLARVSALFHDIGKTSHPHYFTENQRDRSNPHADLSPVESARVIKEHVPHGVALARKHQLPRAVIDTIQQHHGTTLVRYFFQRALEASRAPFPPGSTHTPPDERSFRYDGPKPRSRETAIISLADAVEAAARSLRQPTSDDLLDTINRLVASRLADGQLDEAQLTLEEIARVKQSFHFTLLNMLHSRVAYPAPTTPADAPAPEPQPRP